VRWCAVALALALAAPASAGKCLTIPDALAAQKKVNDANEASLAKQLAAKKLVAIKLVRHRPPQLKPGAPIYKVDATLTIDGVEVVYTGSQLQCGGLADTEFVRQDAQIFRLVRQARASGAPIDVCDCYFPGYRCGGAVAPAIAMLYELPAGTTYGGPIAVAYDAQDSTIRGGVAAKTPCVPPPPPP
jgi:hypothetical protein